MLLMTFCIYPVYFSSRNISWPHYSEWQSLVKRIAIWKLKIKDLALDGAGYSWLPAVLKNSSQTRSHQGPCNFSGMDFLRYIPSSLRLNSAFVVCNSENPLGSSGFCWSWRAGSARRMKWNTGWHLGCTVKCFYALTWRLNQGRFGEDLGGAFAREYVKGVILKDAVGTVIIEVWKCIPKACVSKALCPEWRYWGGWDLYREILLASQSLEVWSWRDCRIPATSKFLLASWLWHDLVVLYQDLLLMPSDTRGPWTEQNGFFANESLHAAAVVTESRLTRSGRLS